MRNSTRNSHVKSCSDCFLKKEISELHPTSRTSLLQSRTARTVSPGTCILSQGSIAASLYCISQGQINAMENDVDGRSFLIFTLKRRGLFPLLALFSSEPTKFEFVSPGPATLCQFPLQSVQDLLNTDPSLSKVLLQRACRQGVDAYKRMAILQAKGTSEKVLQTLHQFKDENSICSLSRQEIATWTNLTIETVIRTLTSLEEKKRIKKLNRMIVVC